MKYSIIYLSLTAILFSCTQTTFIDNPGPKKQIVVQGEPDVTYTNTTTYQQRVGLVSMQYQIQTDYPSGRANFFTVWNNNEIIDQGSQMYKGQHTFLIQKAGYEDLKKDVWIDGDAEGKYVLVGMLRAKQRVVQFNILDGATNTPIAPDKVTVAGIGWQQEQQMISDRSFVTPGQKLIVINKSGYKDYSQQVEIPVGEDPYILTAIMRK